MRIFGAGMAGLLAANMLRRFGPPIHEQAEELPNNHHALLRFRSNSVSEATSIPFRKVQVYKGIMFEGVHIIKPFISLSNMYSMKVTRQIMERSILDLSSVERYISPPDFVAQLAKGQNIIYNSKFDYHLAEDIIKMGKESEPLISTIPMPYMMDLFHWEDKPKFNSISILTGTATIADSVDVYQTLYYPEPGLTWYRASIMGNKFIVEFLADDIIEYAEDAGRKLLEVIIRDFGIVDPHLMDVTFHRQQFGKIAPIPDQQRKQFILALSDLYNIYSIGRFATWRQILLDDVVHDIKVIEGFITERDSYKRRFYYA
jgi:hypothetical protein